MFFGPLKWLDCLVYRCRKGSRLLVQALHLLAFVLASLQYYIPFDHLFGNKLSLDCIVPLYYWSSLTSQWVDILPISFHTILCRKNCLWTWTGTKWPRSHITYNRFFYTSRPRHLCIIFSKPLLMSNNNPTLIQAGSLLLIRTWSRNIYSCFSGSGPASHIVTSVRLFKKIVSGTVLSWTWTCYIHHITFRFRLCVEFRSGNDMVFSGRVITT